METMHAAGRRNLPPVPRPASDVPAVAVPAASAGSPEETPAEQTMTLEPRLPDDAAEVAPGDDDAAEVASADDDTAVFAPAVDLHVDDALAAALDPAALAAADEPEVALEDDDPAQDFVSRLRAAAAEFATAAGAQTAVVREAVPPARHRRSRCRVVLQYADGAEADLTFLGAVGRPGTPAWQGFDEQIQQWLGTGQQRQPAWLVEDAEGPDGVAVDVPAGLAAG
jgi:hypothetical protein